MSIVLDRIGWEDEPSTNTPIDSGNLKKMEDNAEKGINELETNLKWKSVDLNLSNNQSYTLEEPSKVSEILVKFEYTGDVNNFATVHVINDGGSGYYGMAGYYWQETTKNYSATVAINWGTGKITCSTDKAKIKKIFYR